MSKLLEKIIIVTGAASGIGRAAAFRFASDGAHVVAFDINNKGLTDALSQIDTQGGSASAFQVDLTQADQVEKALADVAQQHGHIDGLFNVAGGSGRKHGDGPIDICSLDGWDYTLTLNLTSVFHMCKFALPYIRDGGFITNLGSVLGMTGNAEFATHAYAASKGAIISLSKAMAVYYAARGIRVNVIAPGLVKTGMSARAESNEAIIAMMKRLQPLIGSIGEAEAVADVAAFLASDDARLVTGVVIPVDGGWTAQ